MASGRSVRRARAGKALPAPHYWPSDPTARPRQWGVGVARAPGLPTARPTAPSGPGGPEALPLFSSASYPRFSEYFVLEQAPNSGCRRPGRATCAPRSECAPRPKGGACRLPGTWPQLQPAAATRRSLLFLLSGWLLTPPPPTPTRALPAASPGPPVCLSSLAGGGRTLGGSGRGTGECHPQPGPKPFACPKGQGRPVGPRGAGEEGGRLSLPFPKRRFPSLCLFFLTLSYPRKR